MSIKESYSDIFATHNDSQLEECLEKLESVYQEHPSPMQLTWSRFQMQLPHATIKNRQPWYSTAFFGAHGRRFSLSTGLALCILVALIYGSAVYASGGIPQILQDILNMESDSTVQLVPINQTFKADGRTLTLHEGYADGNLITLGLSLTLPHTPTPDDTSSYWYISSDSKQFRLTTSQGISLPISDASSIVAKKGDLQAIVYEFNTANMTYNQKDISLHLEIPAKCDDSQQCTRIAKFDFTLPFHTTKSVSPHQAITLNGKTLRLEKIIASPATTRFYIGGFSMDDITPPSTAQSNPPTKTFTSKRFNVILSNGKQTIPICTVVYGVCKTGVWPAYKLDFIKKEVQDSFWLRAQRTSGKASSWISAGGGIGGLESPFSLYLGNDHSTIGISLLQTNINWSGNWKLIVTQTTAQLKMSKDPKTGNISYVPTGPFMIDPAVKPWIFTIHLP